MEDKLNLKTFREEDIDLLYEWVNDIECRKNSFHTDSISYNTHKEWCYDKLKSNIVDIFIAYLGKTPIGQLRLSYEDNKAFISYSIDKKFRGIGLGQKVIQLIELEKLYDEKKIDVLVGKVKYDNIASQKVFEHCMYEKKIVENHFVYIKFVN